MQIRFGPSLMWSRESYFELQITLPISQLPPVYPGTQVQVYELIPSLHVPPFWQGLESHSLISKEKIQTLYQIFWSFWSRINRNSKISIIIGYFAGFLVITLWPIDDKTTYFTVVSWITKITIASIWIDAVDASSSILTRAWSAFIYIYRRISFNIWFNSFFRII